MNWQGEEVHVAQDGPDLTTANLGAAARVKKRCGHTAIPGKRFPQADRGSIGAMNGGVPIPIPRAINILHMRDGNHAGGQGMRRYHAGRCKGATLLPEADRQGDSQYNVK
ncbi:hypothetical protein NDU88_003702 [Pleurodeles waltl]|uniref:Uncharacterized protein n=1 Tax=Pleurodeles waltl TaxID=8319 RepID=A0AAV7MSE2_PLEWA|nr:hypothetical protein NDU88_003702 [Pleurodeles waltl]